MRRGIKLYIYLEDWGNRSGGIPWHSGTRGEEVQPFAVIDVNAN